MIKIKIGILITLIIFLILHLTSFQSSFDKLERVVIFVLFFIYLIIDLLQFDYISFIISASGVVIFNVFFDLDFSISTLAIIEKVYLVLILIWILAYLFFNSKESKKELPKNHYYDEESKSFIVIDGPFMYQINPELTDNLNEYIQKSNIGIVDIWYRHLSDEDRKKVKKKLISQP